MAASMGPDPILSLIVFKGTHGEIVEALLEGLKRHLEYLWVRYLVLREHCGEHCGEPDAEEQLMSITLDIAQCLDDAKLYGGFGEYPLAKHITEIWELGRE
jgi:hypothetical protein